MSNLLTHPVALSVKKYMTGLDIKQDASILVGLSGGVDSMVLVFILHRLGYSISAAHVNFNLRGEESHNDALFVSQWCTAQGIPFYELNENTKAYADLHGVNTQVAARDIRYEWWDFLIQTQAFNVVATAHHLDDNIETVFLNLIRGTGIKGLRGIPHKRDFYIRPLLECSREEIEAYALRFEIPFRTDSSNATDAYRRNRLRHQLIPLLEEISPGFHASFKHTLRRVNLEWEVWDHAWRQWQDVHVHPRSDGFLFEMNQHDAPFLMRWLEDKGLPWNLVYDFISSVSPESGNMLTYEQFRLSRIEGGFFFEEIQPAIDLILPHPGHYAFGHFELTIEKTLPENFAKEYNARIEYVSAEVMQFPLHIRSIKPGDHFQPLGMHGKVKKIQDLLVDHKLEMYEKERILLLSNESHILWVIGLRLDERAKVKSEDSEIYKLVYTHLSKD